MNGYSILKVQPATLREVPPAVIVDRAVDRFDALAVTSPDTQEYRFKALADAALAAGLEVAWWDAAAYWNVAGLPDECNVKAVWAEAPRDWANLNLRLTRDLIAARVSRILDSMGDYIDLYFADYLRYGYNWHHNSSGLLTDEGVTTTMAQLRSVVEKTIIANVFRWPDAVYYAQHWAEWLYDSLVDGVSARYYDRPDDLSIAVPSGIGIEKVGVCMAVGGVRDFDALSEAEVGQYLQVAADKGFDRPSVFDWPNVERLGYWELFPERAPVPDVRRYTFTIDVAGVRLSGTVDLKSVE